jgi:hypothetical protein
MFLKDVRETVKTYSLIFRAALNIKLGACVAFKLLTVRVTSFMTTDIDRAIPILTKGKFIMRLTIRHYFDFCIVKTLINFVLP